MKMLVLGAGLQGSACAFDLLQADDVEVVRIADLNVDRLPAILAPFAAKGGRLEPMRLDVREHGAVLEAMRGFDAAMSAIPYYFNLDLARLSTEAGVHFADLGGNTEIVFRQKELDSAARSKGRSIVPDVGLAPGMVNVLAEEGIRRFDSVDSVRIYVGGLPQDPEPPLNYQIVYSIEGVLDYYTTLSWVLRGGKRTQVKALSERERVEFPEPIGELEAFHTAGGLSTMAFRYEGKIPTMEYKTLRYPGHALVMEAIRDLGLLGLEPVDVRGHRVVPRDVFIATAGPLLTKKDGRDLVALRVVVEGTKAGRRGRAAFELVDRFDAERGVSAMMRATGYSLAIVGRMQATGEIAPGVHTPDECVPFGPYVKALAARGVTIREAQ